MNRGFNRFISFILALAMMVGMVPYTAPHTNAEETEYEEQNAPVTEKLDSLMGKTISILGDSISTFSGVSNNTSYNTTIGSNAVYYSGSNLGISRADTWWQQTIDALGLELLVNNSWSGSSVLHTRRGTAGAYVDRCVQLHNDKTGEEPDIIVVYMGGNDFNYYQDTLGTGDIDYTALISENADGSFTYAEPVTTCEAYAIMLHKIQVRYPDADIYCMTSTPRRVPDKEDNYPDVGQPTVFNTERIKIATHFGCTVVDIENCGIPKEAEGFDQYIGDGRSHPNKAGMDLIAQALVRAMLGTEATLHDVSGEYVGVDTDNGAAAVVADMGYTANLTPQSGYSDVAVTVTMDGLDVTETVYANGTICIENVTGDIVIKAVGQHEPMSFRWEMADGELVSTGETENKATKLAGNVVNGVLKDARYQLAASVILKHDRPWVLEWKCADDWRGVVLSTNPLKLAPGRCYLTRTKGGQLCFGSWNGTQYDNYGVDLSGLNSQTHSYRLENRIAADGSNMIWLYVDEAEIGPMNNYYVGSNAQNATSDWLSGRDFSFAYIGSDTTTLNNCALDYIQVHECVHVYKNHICTICGAEAPTLAGKTISILGASISTFAGTTNGVAADTTNSTIRNNVKYYPNTTISEVALNDTWWMQVAEDLDLRLLVNNAWSGSAILLERSGTVGAYVDRCVQLHDNTGDNAGEEPDIICIQMGFNDFSYGKDTLGTADINYDALITADGYGTPTTTMEATAIMLDKMVKRYPNAEIYMFNHFKRIGQSASETTLMENLNDAIATVCARYGVTVVDLYSALTEPGHIGDGRLHPNRLGMDTISEAVKETIIAHTDYAVETHTVTLNRNGVTASYVDSKIVVAGDVYSVELNAADELNVTVTMGGNDITQNVYADGKVTIDEVTADVTITAESIHNPKNYRWEFNGTDLVCVNGDNDLTKNAGTTTDGVFSNTRYALENEVVLLHDRSWAVEWKCEGTFLNTNGSSGARVFTSDNVNANYNARYIFKSNTKGLIAMGEKTTSGSHNYGIALADHNIDWTALHTYRLENRIAEDGSNMIWLFVDGEEIGPMVNYYVGTTDKKTTSNWLSGKDFVFPYMGTDTNGFTNASIEFVAVWEGGHIHDYAAVVTAPTCTEQGYTTYTCACGDSYVEDLVDATGHAYENGICAICGGVAMDKEIPDFLDDIAWENLTYRDIFITNNKAYLNGFNDKTFSPFLQNTGTNTVTKDVCYTGPYSLSAFGTTSQQIKSVDSLPVGEYFVASKVYCTRYAAGELGVCLYSTTVGVTEVTDGFVTAAGIVSASTSGKIFIGSIHSADLDGYVDDTVVIDMSIFTTKPTETELTALYETYVDLEKAIDREEIPYTDQECLNTFVEYMNDKATSLGMNNSQFVDPVGMDNLTTAYDLMRLMVYAYSNYEDLNTVWGTDEHTISVEGISHREYSLDRGYFDSPYLEPYYHIVGAKGGSLLGPKIYNFAAILEIPNSNDKLAVVAMYAEGTQEGANGSRAAVKQVADAAMIKYNNPAADNSTVNVCCQSAIACLIPAEGVDFNNLQILYSKDADIQRSPASISKVLTAICVLDLQKDLSENITYKMADTDIGGFYVNDFVPGETVTYENALYALMLKSSNVTAMALARSCGNLLLTNDHTHAYTPNVTSPTCTEQGYTTYTCACGDSYVDDYVDATGHTYENGICTGCGEECASISLRYDDHYDVTGKAVEIIDAGKPTSYKVGYGVAEGTLDTAVVTLDGDTLIATGIGTAQVKIDGTLYEITVEAAPISLLLLIGQSNMEGMVGNANQSIACENGQVYSTYAKANGLTGDAGLTVGNAGNYVPSALTGMYSAVNVNGTDTKLSGYPVNSLTEAGKGKYGADSGIAYEWTKQTGEKVWVVNAAHGASSITSWQKGASNYEEAVALFSACQTVLKKEIAAGHYTFSHMGYYWCQGCADETKTAEWYVGQYLGMHENLKVDLAFDADLDASTTDKTLEFGNIILVMAGHETAAGYRKGTYTDSSDAFFATFKELEMRGPRVAQIWMANNPELADINMVCTLAQDWVTMPDGTDGVSEYFRSHYENGTVDYPTQTAQSDAWRMPTTPANVKNSIHYYQIGYNEVGREATRNTLYIMGLLEKPEVEPEVVFYDWTGYQEQDVITSTAVGSSATLVVPMVYPCYESKNITYIISDGLKWDYYDLLDTGVDGGTLTASIGTQAVTVTGRQYCSYRFELVNGEMISISNDTFHENLLTATNSNTYTLADTILLKHDKEWVVEFDSVADARFMALASSKSATDGMFYFFKSKSGSGVLSIGEYKDGLYQNYGLKQTEIDIDWTQSHVYQFRNKVNKDGSNTIHIYIDDEWMGTATNLIINDVLQSKDNTYLSGKDFAFTSIGCGGFTLADAQMTYLEVWETACTHTYKSTRTAPTCTEQGYTTHSCTVCGDSYMDDYVDATGHKFGDWTVTKAATCTEEGTERRECGNCDHYETRTIEATGHDYKSVVTAPTCTEKGYTTYTCGKCGDEYVDSHVEATGHSWGDWEVIKEPNAQEFGLRQRTCAVCGKTEQEEIPKLEIVYGDANDDGGVNALDLILLRQYLAGWDVTIADGADANGDGAANALDLILLRQYLAGWDVKLGPAAP